MALQNFLEYCTRKLTEAKYEEIETGAASGGSSGNNETSTTTSTSSMTSARKSEIRSPKLNRFAS